MVTILGIMAVIFAAVLGQRWVKSGSMYRPSQIYGYISRLHWHNGLSTKKEGLTSVQDLKDNLTKIKEEKERYWVTLTNLMNIEQKLLIPSQARARADRYSTRH